MSLLVVPPVSSADPLHNPGEPGEHWSTDNIGEAMPGVLSPLGASVWDTVANNMLGRVAYALGVFSAAERDAPHHWFRLFYGRGALQVEYLALVGDRTPGTTGEEAVRSVFGRAPDEMTWHPTRARYPFVAARLPGVFLGSPRRIVRLAAETDRWWRRQVPRFQSLSLDQARALFADAGRRFDAALTLQTVGLLGCIQPLYDTLEKLVARTGVGDLGVLSGSGGAEIAIVGDLWHAAHARISIDQVVANHGFHGPREGDIIATVWREDPTPLERLLGEYARQGADPRGRDADAERLRADMQRRLAREFPGAQRPAVQALLRLAARRIPLRGVAKRAFLQSLDVGRGAARRAGELLVADGVLDEPDDVFYLVTASSPDRCRRTSPRSSPGAARGAPSTSSCGSRAAGGEPPYRSRSSRTRPRTTDR